MNDSGYVADDLLRNWIANDFPVYHFGMVAVDGAREKGGDYGAALKGVVAPIRESQSIPLADGRTRNMAYRALCRAVGRLPDYRKYGYPVCDGTSRETMEMISDDDFRNIDWSRLADDIFEMAK